jgi:hypothetical protein
VVDESLDDEERRMKGQKPFESYRNVPPGSTLAITVSGPAGKFNTDGQLVGSDQVHDWQHGDLVPGPATAKLNGAKRSYFARVRVAFLAQATVTIQATITKPAAQGGGVHSEPCQWQVSGANGQTAIRGLFIDTQ